MPTEKRERQRQGRQARLEAAETARRQSQRNRTIRNVGLLIVGVLVVAFVLSRVFGGDDKQDVATSSASASSGPSTSDTSTSDTVAPPAVTVPPAGASITGDTPCPPADGSAARTTTFEKAPPTCIDPNKTYAATLSTSKGDITVDLDPKAAPQAVNNFVVLSRYHYYDGVAF